MTKVTIEDISRQTGLSRGTVSRALNDRPDISEQTKERVLEACRQLKYVPSHAARSLATGRRYAVAVVVQNLRCQFGASFVRGVLSRARSERYAMHVSEWDAADDSVLEHLSTLVSERVDCVLLATAAAPERIRPVLECLAGRPLVSVAPIEGVICDILAPDHIESGRLAARQVLPAGEFLYVHQADGPLAEERRAGFQEVCRAAGVDPGGRTVDLGSRDGDRHQRLEAVAARLGGVRAVAGSDDVVAMELMLWCARQGRWPGRDIGIMGQGNEPLGAQIQPSLTTIDWCGEEIGRRAMDVALQRVTHARQDSPQTTAVPPALIARESTRLLQNKAAGVT